MSEGDKLSAATQVVEKMNKQDQAMVIMADMLKTKQVELKAYKAKLGRKLTDKEICEWINSGSSSQILDDTDAELLQEAKELSKKYKQLTKK